MPLDPRIWAGDPPRSSYPACIAVKAAAEQGREAPAERYLRGLREGFMCHRRKLDGPEALVEEARRAGLDVQRFRIDLESNAILEAFGERPRGVAHDPDAARQAGLATEGTMGRASSGWHSRASSPTAMARRAGWAATRPTRTGGRPRRPPVRRRAPEPRPDVPAALRRFGRMATAELEAVCDLPGPRAGAEAWRLASEWRVARVPVLFGELWERPTRRTASAGRSTASRTARAPRRAAHAQSHVRAARPARQRLRAAHVAPAPARAHREPHALPIVVAAPPLTPQLARVAARAGAPPSSVRRPSSTARRPPGGRGARSPTAFAVRCHHSESGPRAPGRSARRSARRKRVVPVWRDSVPWPSTSAPPAATRLLGRGPAGQSQPTAEPRRRTRSARRGGRSRRARAAAEARPALDVEPKRRHQQLAVRGVAAHVGVVGEHAAAPSGAARDADVARAAARRRLP